MSITTEITRLQGAKANLKTAIESKGVTVPTGSTLDDFADLVDSISGGGGDDTLEKMLTNTLVSYESVGTTSIHTSAFNGNTNLESVSFPNVTTVGTYAFNGCTKLEYANFPKMTALAERMFRNCTSLAQYDFSNVTTINTTETFYGSGIEGIYAPKAAIGAFANSQFENCTSLIYARHPNHSSGSVIRQKTYKGCTSLKLADIGSAYNFSVGEVFSGCTSLEVLIMRNNSRVVSLGNVNNFTGVGSTVPLKIYVPSSYKDSYKTATNWSTLFNNGTVEFYDLEGSPYESKDFVYMGVPSS